MQNKKIKSKNRCYKTNAKGRAKSKPTIFFRIISVGLPLSAHKKIEVGRDTTLQLERKRDRGRDRDRVRSGDTEKMCATLQNFC